jgi:hypothetical protein
VQLVASVFLVVVGVVVGLFSGVPADMRLFGWLLAVVGALGLGARVLLAHRRNR